MLDSPILQYHQDPVGLASFSRHHLDHHSIQRSDSALALCDNDWNELSDCNDNPDHRPTAQDDLKPTIDPETASIGYYSRPSSRSGPYQALESKILLNESRSPLLNDRHVISELETGLSDSEASETNANELFQNEHKAEANANRTLLLSSDPEYGEGSLGSGFTVEDLDIVCASDIDDKMAETKIKMNDAMLSNGREELVHSRKMKHFMKQREHLNDGTNVAVAAMTKSSEQMNVNLMTSNNNTPSRQHRLSATSASATGHDDLTIRSKARRSPAKTHKPSVDIYANKCLEIPEKIVKDLEQKLLANDNQHYSDTEKDSDTMDDTEDINIGEGFVLSASNYLEANKENTEPNGKYCKGRDKNAHHRLSWHQQDDCRRRCSPNRRYRAANRRSMPPLSRDRGRRSSSPQHCEFDVYTLESALPNIDWDTIEAHLQATENQERRRRNDREEIRRRLAMGGEEDTNEGGDRRPSLQSRLQTGMNLQICFMNETASDCESQCSDTESTQDHRIDLPKGSKALHQLKGGVSCNADFRTRQIQLQAEARLALSQAKDMARMQMEVDRQSKRCSPVTEIIRDSFIKIGLTFPDNKRRLSRQMLTDMNVAQLQVIVNHLHSQIESLNEELVRLLLDRDDFHMEQDSRLVDIEDLTNHLAAKERSNSTSSSSSTSKSSSSTASTPSSATLPPSTHTPSPQLVKPPILSSSSK